MFRNCNLKILKKTCIRSKRSTLMQHTFRSLGTDRVNFAKKEEEVLAYWKKIDAFKKQLELTKDKPAFTFYDGPPFATGLPHYGHILAGTIKDVITRYATMKGHYVERRFGWDCHGVPIEFEIEKQLQKELGKENFGRDDVLEMGIKNYNGRCRGIVQKYTKEWETIVERSGRWIDFKNNYKTMDVEFMESVWWVFGELHKKGLVYEGFKVMPYSTKLNTPLSNFEAKQNYVEVIDPAVVVSFPVIDDPEGCEFLAWTTTPWTLPSNLALCVNPKLDYVKVKDTASGRIFILGEGGLPEVYPPQKKKKKKKDKDSGPPYTILGKFKGKDLVGKRYKPLFDYFKERGEGGTDHKKNFVVVAGDYVTADTGTCVVHQAPGFGEDDYWVCLKAGLITAKDVPCPIDHVGCFTEKIPEYKGVFVKDADKQIMKDLDALGRLIKRGQVKHNYPHCWRTDSPLLYRTVPSWFVKVTDIKEKLLECNSRTHWVPDFVKTKRFHNWLKDARDWCVSRNRYWGTPLPIWRSDDGMEIKVISSVGELEKLTGQKITDIHREFVDDLEIPSSEGRGMLKRVDEVFDCWFESGSMPYAQQHYPFENPEAFEAKFPADFIAEGLDQTRGWFYTLMVLSTALFGEPAFKNLIVNGLVLAKNGKKMSKRLRNFPPVTDVMDLYGADAMRVYLMNSPVVRAEPLKFDEGGVKDVVKDIFLPWYNAYKFFIENATRFEDNTAAFVYDPAQVKANCNCVMDKWILSRLQSLVKFFRQEMDGYRLYTVIPELLRFINDLCGYVRLHRDVLQGRNGPDQAKESLAIMFHVLVQVCQLMAPFTPFLTEAMYQNLKNCFKDPLESIHFHSMPEADESCIDTDVEERVEHLFVALQLARRCRDQRNLTMKLPCQKLTIVSPSCEITKGLQKDDLISYVASDVNIRNIELSNEVDQYINLKVVPDNRKLGQRLGRKARAVKTALAELNQQQLRAFKESGSVQVVDETVTMDEVELQFSFSGDEKKFESSQKDQLVVVLDCEITDELSRAGQSREVTSLVQQLRKKLKLVQSDKVRVYYELSKNANVLQRVMAENEDFIRDWLRCPVEPVSKKRASSYVLGSDSKTLDGEVITVYLVRVSARLTESGRKKLGSDAEDVDRYLSQKHYADFAKRKEGSEFCLEINDKTVTLVIGKDVEV